MSEGNKKKSLDQFFQILGSERCSKIKTVRKDLWKLYSLSFREFIPQALEVADPFYVVKRLNEAIVKARNELSVGSELQVTKRKVISNMQ